MIERLSGASGVGMGRELAHWNEEHHTEILSAAEAAILRSRNHEQWSLELIFCSRQCIKASRELLQKKQGATLHPHVSFPGES